VLRQPSGGGTSASHRELISIAFSRACRDRRLPQPKRRVRSLRRQRSWVRISPGPPLSENFRALSAAWL